jgi:hypothetical protein
MKGAVVGAVFSRRIPSAADSAAAQFNSWEPMVKLGQMFFHQTRNSAAAFLHHPTALFGETFVAFGIPSESFALRRFDAIKNAVLVIVADFRICLAADVAANKIRLSHSNVQAVDIHI